MSASDSSSRSNILPERQECPNSRHFRSFCESARHPETGRSANRQQSRFFMFNRPFWENAIGVTFRESCRLQTGEDGSNCPVPLQVRKRDGPGCLVHRPLTGKAYDGGLAPVAFSLLPSPILRRLPGRPVLLAMPQMLRHRDWICR